MKISDLIYHLERIRKTKGDLDCRLIKNRNEFYKVNVPQVITKYAENRSSSSCMEIDELFVEIC